MKQTRTLSQMSHAARHRRGGCACRWLLCWMIVLFPWVQAATWPPAIVEEDGVRFERVGQGAFRWKRIVHAYDACLHAGAGAKPESLLADAPLRLEIRYRRDFSAADIVSGGVALLKRNVSPTTWTNIQSQLGQLNRAYRDVKSDDRYVLTYVPDKGLTLRLNGAVLTNIPGAEFGPAYLRIWLGEQPMSITLREKLLGRDPEKSANP